MRISFPHAHVHDEVKLKSFFLFNQGGGVWNVKLAFCSKNGFSLIYFAMDFFFNFETKKLKNWKQKQEWIKTFFKAARYSKNVIVDNCDKILHW